MRLFAVSLCALVLFTGGVQASEFGTGLLSKTILAAEFQPDALFATVIEHRKQYVKIAPPYPNGTALAPVSLPSGTVIATIEVYSCFDYTGGGAYVFMYPVTLQEGVHPSSSEWLVAGFDKSTEYCGWSPWVGPELGLRVSKESQYQIGVQTLNGSEEIYAVRVNYRREMSPPPHVASFSDVSTSHWAYQSIEAIKAAGITTGCAPGLYCPEDKVTRAEMATFLNRALGLFWP